MKIHYNLEAESIVLGAILLDEQSADVVIPIIDRVEMFYYRNNQTIYRAIMKLYMDGKPIDRTTVAIEIGEKLQGIGGRTYLLELIERSVSSAHLERYSQDIVEKYQRRRLALLADNMKSEAYYSERSSTDLVSEFDTKLVQIQDTTLADYKHISEGTESLKERIKNFKNTKTGIQTGEHDLDNLVVGLEPGDLTYLAAATSMGKTAFSIHLCINMLKNYRVGYIT